MCSAVTILFCLFLAQQPTVGQGLLIHEVSRSHTMHQSVRLLWWGDQPITLQHTTLTTDRHPCSRLDSNPKSQQENGRRPTP